MRYIRYAFLAVLAAVLVSLALANRGMVTLHTLPEGLVAIPGMELLAFSVETPLFIVIFAGIVAGLLIGFVWEWLREAKYRSDAASKRAEIKRLQRELKRVVAETDKDKDEVLALLDRAS